MRSDTRVVFACLAFAVMFAFSTVRRLQAQNNSAPSTIASIDPYLMDRDSEIAMARSAAPQSIAKDATVMVLGRHGYETAVEGKNGFACLVGRSWDLSKNNPAFWDPKIHGPICLSAPAVRSFLPIYLKKTELAIAGRSNDQIEDVIIKGIAKGELPTPEPGSVSYMMSRAGYLNDALGHYLPHLMFYLPLTDKSSWGADLPDSPVTLNPQFQGGPEPITEFVISVGKWSDGTVAPAM